MSSNKILNTLRNTNMVIMQNTIDKNCNGSGNDEFGNQYWAFVSLQSGIDSFTKLNDTKMVEYLQDAVKINAKHGLCSEQDILSEPYVVGYNPKNDVLTDMTLRTYQSMQKYGMRF